MTWDPRLDVVEALESAGWTGDPDNPLGLLRRDGAVWGVTSDSGDSSLTEPVGGQTIDFPSGTAPAVIVAACLAATGAPAPGGWTAPQAQRLRASVAEIIAMTRPHPAMAGASLINDMRPLLSLLLAQIDYLTGRAAVLEAAAATECDTEGHAVPHTPGCPQATIRPAALDATRAEEVLALLERLDAGPADGTDSAALLADSRRAIADLLADRADLIRANSTTAEDLAGWTGTL
ncbi:hypothetical protein [Streptomyces sp. BSE6.1]|uniref:hypothetical protein n=1 Tax=Streptomyces sp. BSE6.1 TaxID=2605730 RepID=UPI001F216BA2|nr:hypothetical protein [Streptomyces sp. BSE6.1]